MTQPKDRKKAAEEVRESARTERHPAVPDRAAENERPAVPGGIRPNAAVAEDPAKPGIVDKSKD